MAQVLGQQVDASIYARRREAMAKVLDDEVAGMMMTCPHTLGLFEKNLPRIVEMLRGVDALLFDVAVTANGFEVLTLRDDEQSRIR